MPLVQFCVGGQEADGEEDGGYYADGLDGGFVACFVKGLFGGVKVC